MVPDEQAAQLGILRLIGKILYVFRLAGLIPRHKFHPFGFGFISKLLGKYIFNPINRHTIFLDPDHRSRLSFYLNDMYWSALALPWAVYEADVQAVLEHSLTPDAFFIDCGANIGYWSAYASARLPADHIIAVEASPFTFEQLKQNSVINRGFACVQAAVSNTDDDLVWFSGSNHASMSIVGREEPKNSAFQCRTITLDTLIQKYLAQAHGRIILKLDIEGAEVSALEGAAELLKHNPLIIYEDHGSDLESRTSRYITEKLGYDLYAWNETEGIKQVTLIDIEKLKKHRIGYNFFACCPAADDWFSEGLGLQSAKGTNAN